MYLNQLPGSWRLGKTACEPLLNLIVWRIPGVLTTRHGDEARRNVLLAPAGVSALLLLQLDRVGNSEDGKKESQQNRSQWKQVKSTGEGKLIQNEWSQWIEHHAFEYILTNIFYEYCFILLFLKETYSQIL